MNPNKMKKSNIIYIAGGILLGLLAGYFLSGWLSSEEQTTEGTHVHEEEGETIYTCSMHPQIRQNEPGLCPICEMELIPLRDAGSGDEFTLTMTPQAVKIAQLETKRVGSVNQSFEGAMELSGHIEINDDQRINEVSYFPGKIERLHIKSEGNYVNKGDKIADVFAPDLRVVQQELISSYARRDENPELYAAAARKMKYWEIDKNMIIEIAESGIVRSFLPIYANHSGVVTDLKVREGDYVTRGSKLMELSDLSTVWVEFDVNESELSKVQRGSSITFTTLAYPGKEQKATINYVDPMIKPSTGTATARATVTNYGNRFKPGMLVKGYASYSKSMESADLLVPASAVLWTGKRSVVYVKDTTSDIPGYQYREVSLGERMGDQYVITEGLKSGEEVVVQGAFSVDAAAQLNNQKSMMNQWVGSGETTSAQQIEVSPPFKESWTSSLENYLKLKEHLVQGDSLQAQSVAETLLSQLQKTESKIVREEVKVQWEKEKDKAFESLESLAASTTLEEQRKYFKDLSDAMIHWAHYFGVDEEDIFVQHCPMAFDDEGANWLSSQENIRNPYFGDRMLKCGQTLEVIK